MSQWWVAWVPDASVVSASAAFTQAMQDLLPTVMRKTLTYDRGSEMARHAELAERLQIEIFFSEPLLTLAARHQREHQRPDSSVPAQRH